jgi:hypothetical protein
MKTGKGTGIATTSCLEHSGGARARTVSVSIGSGGQKRNMMMRARGRSMVPMKILARFRDMIILL